MIRPASGNQIIVTNNDNIRLDDDVDLTMLTVNHNIVLAWNDTSSRFFMLSKATPMA